MINWFWQVLPRLQLAMGQVWSCFGTYEAHLGQVWATSNPKPIALWDTIPKPYQLKYFQGVRLIWPLSGRKILLKGIICTSVLSADSKKKNNKWWSRYTFPKITQLHVSGRLRETLSSEQRTMAKESKSMERKKERTKEKKTQPHILRSSKWPSWDWRVRGAQRFSVH